MNTGSAAIRRAVNAGKTETSILNPRSRIPRKAGRPDFPALPTFTSESQTFVSMCQIIVSGAWRPLNHAAESRMPESELRVLAIFPNLSSMPSSTHFNNGVAAIVTP